jgi:hypothetical protein
VLLADSIKRQLVAPATEIQFYVGLEVANADGMPRWTAESRGRLHDLETPGDKTPK